MDDKLTDKQLSAILSDIFLDTEIDYEYLAKQTQDVDLEYLEKVFFDWVSPVLWSVCFSVAPEWTSYDEDWLWEEVQKYIKQAEDAGAFKKKLLLIRQKLLRRLLKDHWEEFVAARKSLTDNLDTSNNPGI